MSLDDTFERRIATAAELRGRRSLVEMAGLRRIQALPIERVLPSQVERVQPGDPGKAAGSHLTAFAKDYLHAVVDRITVYEGTATI